ncbi:hypothetical protein H8E07_21095 [bacterium]|nr:hypothetical protein [bacterium]
MQASNRTVHLLAILAYAVLIAVLSLDVLRDPAHLSFPSFSRDNYLSFWNLWSVSDALSHGRNPFFTHLLFHPTGTTLVFTEFTPLYGLLAAPLVLAMGPPYGAVLAHNLLVILSFVATGYATFLFAAWMSGSRAGGFLAGLLLAFSAYRFHHLEHLNLLATHWIPLAGWLIGGWLLRGRGLPDGGPPPSRRRLVWIGLLAFGLTATSFTVAAFTVVFLALWLGLTAIVRTGAWWPGAWRRTLLAGGAFALGALPLGLAWLGGGGGRVAHPGELVRWSPDVLGFVTPQDSALLGPLVASAAAGFHRPSGEEVYLGWALIVAAALGLVALKRRGIPLLVAALCSLAVACGPGLWLAGTHHAYAPNPYGLLIGAVPILEAIRTPNRFVLPAMVALVPLAAAGVVWLSARRAGRWAVPVLVVLALVELVPGPIEAVPVRIPELYFRMGVEPTPGAVIELPIRDLNDLNKAAYHTLAHRRPLAGGPLLRPSGQARAFEQRSDLQSRLRTYGAIPGAVADLREQGYAFIVWHRWDLDAATWGGVLAVYSELAELWHVDQDVAVFKL